MPSSLHAQRQLRQRVLEALDARVKGFRRREELWPLRVPEEPILLDAVVAQALGDEQRVFDRAGLRSRTLLQLEWEDGSLWSAWVCTLPSGLKLYCDTGDGESRVLASGGRNEGDGSDRAFLELLAESGGEHFGIEMAGEPPSRVRTGVRDRPFLVNLFVTLFEVTGLDAAVRAQMAGDRDGGSGADFEAAVDRWLLRAMARRDAAAGRGGRIA